MKTWELNQWNKPSRKTLEADFPGKGKELRELIVGDVHPDNYKSVQDLVGQCWHGPTYSHMLLTAINEIIEGHGIEQIIPKDEDRHPSYEYINMGDTYNATILLRSDGRLIVASWGDIVEQHMDWYD
jgi:hypothetical protein